MASQNKRPPNELETCLHQAALAASKRQITPKQAEAVVPNTIARMNALNFLSGVGLLKILKDSKGNIQYFRAVTKEELAATRSLTNEESLVLNPIRDAGNEGIWTKHLKAKTNLHQTVIERCLKNLTQKRLIKRVHSVQYQTRKIYMLEGLEPSVSLTGGPWYTDNELDTEFIKNLTDACYKLICDVSFPKPWEGNKDAVYSISNAPQYPTAQHITNLLRKARLTETDLTVEHVETLLNVLYLDGKIEKLPAFGHALWESEVLRDESTDGSKSSMKKRKRFQDDPTGDDLIEEKKKKRKQQESPQSNSRVSSSTTILSSARKGKQKSDASDQTDVSSDESPRASKSLNSLLSTVDVDDLGVDVIMSGGIVYRAVKEVPLVVGALDAPCTSCPVFDFCKDGGPVNAQECVYYDEWLVSGTVASSA